ncbi:MAG: thiol reductant ABC exporter subunit CydD [Acidisphaera sp.]|nr:thiol reductant ABC exporter subunit CydD [Acidisphaera sp.]
MSEATRPTRVWLRQQTALARRAAAPVAGFGLAGILFAIGQAGCAALALQAALLHRPLAGWPLLAFAGLALARAAVGLLGEQAAAAAGAAARRRLRDSALASLLAAGPALLRRFHSAALAAICVDRVEALDGLFARWAPAAVLAVAGPALVAGALLAADPFAGLVVIGAGLLVPVGMAVAGIGASVASRRQFQALQRLQTRFLDRVRGIATIVLANRAGDEAQALAAAAQELRRRTMRVLRVAFLSSTILDAAMAAALVGLALHYGHALLDGGVERPWRALFALLLVPEFFAPLRAYSAAYQDRLHAETAAQAFVDLPGAPAVAETPPLAVRTVEARGISVAFENVRLTWDPAVGPALDGLSFRLAAAETLVIAGPSGAGKSTILEILLGFVRPDEGRVTLNGAEIATIVPQALMRMTAWIGQRPLLFAGSLRDNVAFARPEATEEEIAEAVRAAQLTAFAESLPHGLDTPIGEGGYGLSGGQAQRVAIARAFLKNAPLLLLDEPTAHLDPATEAEVLESLRRLALGRTVILASHSAAAHAFSGRRIDLRNGRAQAPAERGAA